MLSRWIDVLRPLGATAYVLTRERRLLWSNPAWSRFASENGGAAVLDRWPLGSSVDDAFDEPLRGWYAQRFAEAAARGERWEHDYECNSPTEFRAFRMLVYPVRDHFVVVHAPRLEAAAPDRPIRPRDDARYGTDGTVRLCSHCRCARRVDGTGWDWVPAYLDPAQVPTSHGLCETCVPFYWPDRR